jgi:polar amino acid transport system substrate-binding protein
MRNLFLVIVLSLAASVAFSQSIHDITWHTEEYPPFNYKEDGVVKGVAVDFLLAIWKKLGVNKTRSDIKMVPWARGVRILETRKNTCLFSTSLTSSRINVLGWKFAYPIPRLSDTSENQLVAKIKKGLVFNSAQDVVAYEGKFGVIRGDVGVSLLEDLGVSRHKLMIASSPQQLTQMLHAGRFDVVSYSLDAMRKAMAEVNIDEAEYEGVYTFPIASLGYAFHHSTDPMLIKQVQQAIDELYEEGIADEIVEGYR